MLIIVILHHLTHVSERSREYEKHWCEQLPKIKAETPLGKRYGNIWDKQTAVQLYQVATFLISKTASYPILHPPTLSYHDLLCRVRVRSRATRSALQSRLRNSQVQPCPHWTFGKVQKIVQ